MVRLLLILIALALSAAAAAHAAPAPRTEVAIREVRLSNGALRYAVPISIGRTAMLVSLDTGSTGLRILPGALGPADATASAEPESYGYASGSRYEGVVGEATLTMGEAKGTAPVHLIKSIGCYAYLPHCPASRTTLAQYGIASDGLPGEGFKAILGIDMAPGRVGNPLLSLGVRRWIVELPRPGEGDGRLILNPSEAETEGYAMVPLAAPYAHERGGGLHDAAPGCLSNPAIGGRACGVVLLDTGAPGLSVANGRLDGPPWPDGSQAVLELFDTTGGLAARAAMTVGLRDQGTRLTYRQEARVFGVVIYAGVAPYYAYSVLYDPRRQMIGLRPRPPGPAAGGPRAVASAADPPGR
ncbi:hypothetical protein [Phenylobacterium sp.]|jgi:hypothetical protein|uniref:hypothetical protein n=1 Tax=Phenylobacterium sp. TaxID=1871053 RepID=UPI002E37FC05|nr:hypothetical protein [Phenylobacterium sp.]HEX4709610.1 hypothetical protein [Phenylobacterium sp.]